VGDANGECEMSTAWKVYEKSRYHMNEPKCIGYKCFAPGMYQHRGASSGGSKSSGQSAMCLTSAHRGCPAGREYDKALAAKRKADGWRIR